MAPLRVPRPATHRAPRGRARCPAATASGAGRRARAGPSGRRPAARAEILKALVRDASGAHPGRADRGPDAAGDRRPDRRSCGRLEARAGTSIVFITHKLKEVRALADRITVIRRGKVVGEASRTSISEGELASMMVGRQVKLDDRQGRPSTPGDVDARGARPELWSTPACQVTRRRRELLRSAAARSYALAGVQGNGQTELTECPGRARVGGVGVGRPRRAATSPISRDRRPMIGLGRRLCPRGPACTTAWSAASPSRRTSCSTSTTASPSPAVMSLDLERDPTERHRRGSRSSTSGRQSIDHPCVHAVRRQPAEGRARPRAVPAADLVLIVAQPTRGLDVGSMEFVHKRIVEERDNGAAVILLSRPSSTRSSASRTGSS